MMLTTVVLFIAAYVSHLEPLYGFSLRFNDLNFAFDHKRASDDVVLVAVDEKSVNRFGRWPWSRDIIAKAVDHLDESNILLFDMVFSEPTEDDDRLGESIEEQGSAICGFFLRHHATAKLSPLQREIISDTSLDRLASDSEGERLFVSGAEAEVNIESILSACALSATFSTLTDSDQILRGYPLAFTFDGEIIPSMGVQALRLYFNSDIRYLGNNSYEIAHHRMITDDKGFVRLNYYPLQSYKIFSFADLYDGKIKSEALHNKIVIFGLSEMGLGDTRITPIGAIPGPLVHYTFISNVLNDELLYENSILTWAALLLFLLLAMMLRGINSIYLRVGLYIVSYTLYFALTKLLYFTLHLYIDAFYPMIALLLTGIVSESLLYKEQEKQMKFVKSAFSSYLSPLLLRKLIKEPEKLELGGEKKELTVFFSDIRDFTSISEKMDAQALTHYLNHYFTPMSDIVTQHNGMIDKYIGDALMAFYNAPVDVEDHAGDACRASLEMIRRLEELNREFLKEGLPPIAIGIGLNTAEVVVGNMGSSRRFNYTVIGDGVNLASRVEGLNKSFGTQILITEFTKAKIGERFLTRPLEKVQVKGKDEEVMLYELLEDTEENRARVERFMVALRMYEAREDASALQHFERALEDDQVCQYFIDAIKHRS